jgi:hypothetical protein
MVEISMPLMAPISIIATIFKFCLIASKNIYTGYRLEK